MPESLLRWEGEDGMWTLVCPNGHTWATHARRWGLLREYNRPECSRCGEPGTWIEEADAA